MKKLLLMLVSIFMLFGLMACDSSAGVASAETFEKVEKVDGVISSLTYDSVKVEIKLVGILFDEPEDFEKTKLKAYVNSEKLNYVEYDPTAEGVSYLHKYFYMNTDSCALYTTNRNDQRGYYTYEFSELSTFDEIIISGAGEFYSAKVAIVSADETDTVTVEQFFTPGETDFRLRFKPQLKDSLKLSLEYY